MKRYLLFIVLSCFSTTMAQVTANAGSDKAICFLDTLHVSGQGLNNGDSGTYQWRDIASNNILSGKANLVFKITDTSKRYFELKVTKIINGSTYIDLDTFVLSVLQLPTFSVLTIPSRCYNDGCLKLTQIDFAKAMPDNQSVHYYQNRKPSWISGTSSQIWCPLFSNKQVPKSGLNDTVCFEYTAYNGCYNSDCRSIRLNANPEVKVNDGLFCQKDGLVNLDKLAVIPFSKVGGVESWRCIEVPQGSGVDPDLIILTLPTTPPSHWIDIGLENEVQKTGDYLVEYCFKNPSSGCASCDTAKLRVARLPEFEFDDKPTSCVKSILVLDSFVHLKRNLKSYTGGSWRCVEFSGSRDMGNSMVKNAISNSVYNAKYFKPADTGSYLLKFEDVSSGCSSSDSAYFFVNGLPVIKLTLPDTVCSSAQSVKLESNYLNDSNGHWSGMYIDSGFFFPAKAFASGLGSFMINYQYRDAVTLCENFDSVDIYVSRTPDIDFQWSRKNGQDTLYDFSLSVPDFDSSQYSVFWDFGTGLTSILKNPANIKFNMNDTYAVKCIVVNQQGCSDTLVKNFIAQPKSNVHQYLNNSSVRVFPNPSAGIINILTERNFHLTVTDVTGKVIFQTNNSKSVNLWKGFYVLKFEIDETIVIEKVIIF